MKTSEKIKELRISKGLSQEQLGELIGVKRAAINKYETGRVVNIKRTSGVKGRRFKSCHPDQRYTAKTLDFSRGWRFFIFLTPFCYGSKQF